mgnify:CR=1 FL=1
MLEDTGVPVKKLLGSSYSRILTYPVSDKAEAKARIKELSGVGVTALRFHGLTQIDGIPVLGKGCVGLVTEAVLDGVPVALKIRRTDANRVSMASEGRLLRLANSVDVGPRLISATRNFLAMELFDGIPLFRWVERPAARSVTRVKRVLRLLLASCFRLDAIGLDHGELSHAPKNVLINDAGIPCIVDFESASPVRRPANLTSLLQYFLFGKISGRIRSSGFNPRRRSVLDILTGYKKDNSVDNFRSILEVLQLP